VKYLFLVKIHPSIHITNSLLGANCMWIWVSTFSTTGKNTGTLLISENTTFTNDDVMNYVIAPSSKNCPGPPYLLIRLCIQRVHLSSQLLNAFKPIHSLAELVFSLQWRYNDPLTLRGGGVRRFQTSGYESACRAQVLFGLGSTLKASFTKEKFFSEKKQFMKFEINKIFLLIDRRSAMR